MRTLLSLLIVLPLSLSASELVYQPVNPNFGGDALNGPMLLNNAQSQNDFKDPDYEDLYSERTALDRVTDSLESRLLNQLLTDVGDGNSGSLSTDEFVIDFIDNGGQLTITIIDRATGEQSVIEVDGLNPANP